MANSPAADVRDCEAVITMLADDAVQQMVFGESGFAPVLKPGALHVSSSTISTALARRLTAEHSARGRQYLRAPVFGRPEAASAKKLLVVAAGAAQNVDRWRPIFDAMSAMAFDQAASDLSSIARVAARSAGL